MSRLTITLDDSMHQALKEAAARQGRSIGKLIEEGLVLRGVRQLVARARSHAMCNDEDSMQLAIEETRATRTT